MKQRSSRAWLAAGVLVLLAAVPACSKSDSSSSTSTTAGTTPATASQGNKKTTDASSDELKMWQKDLNAVGCDAGPVDGIDGGETDAAIRNFQAAEGLTVDGQIGPQTGAALTQAAASGQQVCTPAGTTTTTAKSTSSTSASSSTSTTTPANPCSDPVTRGQTPLCWQISISPTSGPANTVVTVTTPAAGCGVYGPKIEVWANQQTVATGQLGAPDANGNQTGTVTIPTGLEGQVVQVGTVAASVPCMRQFSVTG